MAHHEERPTDDQISDLERRVARLEELVRGYRDVRSRRRSGGSGANSPDSPPDPGVSGSQPAWDLQVRPKTLWYFPQSCLRNPQARNGSTVADDRWGIQRKALLRA
jgi:hypothetical protein